MLSFSRTTTRPRPGFSLFNFEKSYAGPVLATPDTISKQNERRSILWLKSIFFKVIKFFKVMKVRLLTASSEAEITYLTDTKVDIISENLLIKNDF